MTTSLKDLLLLCQKKYFSYRLKAQNKYLRLFGLIMVHRARDVIYIYSYRTTIVQIYRKPAVIYICIWPCVQASLR